MAKVYFTKSHDLHGPRTQLKCCVCGETDRDKFKVEQLGIAAGPTGDDYTFCQKCWNSKKLGQNILNLLGYPNGMSLLDETVEVEEIE